VITPVTATEASQVAAGADAAKEAEPMLLAERDRIAKLRAHLTLSDDPELARQVLEDVATSPHPIARKELESRWGPGAPDAVEALLDAGLVTSITCCWQARIRASHLVDGNPKIYEKPDVLQRATDGPIHIPLDRVAYHPDSGFVVNVEQLMYPNCIDWCDRALFEPKGDGKFEVTVRHRTKFPAISRKEFAAQGVFTVAPTVFQARRCRIIRSGVPCVQLLAPNQPVAEPATLALA
jgi:hypothetical protein